MIAWTGGHAGTVNVCCMVRDHAGTVNRVVWRGRQTEPVECQTEPTKRQTEPEKRQTERKRESKPKEYGYWVGKEMIAWTGGHAGTVNVCQMVRDHAGTVNWVVWRGRQTEPVECQPN